METLSIKVTLTKPVITPQDRLHLCTHIIRELLNQNVLVNPRQVTVDLDTAEAVVTDKQLVLAVTSQ